MATGFSSEGELHNMIPLRRQGLRAKTRKVLGTLAPGAWRPQPRSRRAQRSGNLGTLLRLVREYPKEAYATLDVGALRRSLVVDPLLQQYGAGKRLGNLSWSKSGELGLGRNEEALARLGMGGTARGQQAIGGRSQGEILGRARGAIDLRKKYADLAMDPNINAPVEAVIQSLVTGIGEAAEPGLAFLDLSSAALGGGEGLATGGAEAAGGGAAAGGGGGGGGGGAAAGMAVAQKAFQIGGDIVGKFVSDEQRRIGRELQADMAKQPGINPSRWPHSGSPVISSLWL